MIPKDFIKNWRQKVNWLFDRQVEQDLVISRALVALYNHPEIMASLAFRGGTALNKLFFSPATRYSEDLDFVQINDEPIGKTLSNIRSVLDQKAMLEETAWIVEGCSFSTFEMRFAKADVLIYFHFSRLVCFWRFFKRLFNYKREFGGLQAINWELLKYTWNFDKEKRARIEELRDKYPQTDFLIFRTQKDADLFIEDIC